jgi:SAM-dependent methyltransferase
MIDESAVSTLISPGDEMLSTSLDRAQYFRCGRSAVESIHRALDAASIPPARIKRILDLPCGHGRVLRYLRAAFPEAAISACDLLREGVDFCASTFGATAIYSCDEPEAIPLERAGFDLIWVGSLFTHLDAPLWPRFLAALRNALCPGGLLVFSAHGREAYQRVVGGMWIDLISHRRRTQLLYGYERSGFGYAKYAGSEGYYGLSLSHPAWVTRQITTLGGLRLVSLSERSWEFHDIFASVREDDCAGDMRQMSRAGYLRHVALDGMNPRLRSGLEKIWGTTRRFRTRRFRQRW